MDVMSSPSRQKSWRRGRERVSVLATLAVQKETVSRVLIELREQHKPPGSSKPLSQEKAAARAGVTGRQWQRWESGESDPYLRNLEAVAQAFDIPLAEFLGANEQDDTTTPMSLETLRGDFREIIQKLDAGETDRRAIEQAITTQNVNLITQTEVLDRINEALERIETALVDLPTVAAGLAAVLQQLELDARSGRQAGGGG